jgi:hypothetical protein
MIKFNLRIFWNVSIFSCRFHTTLKVQNGLFEQRIYIEPIKPRVKNSIKHEQKLEKGNDEVKQVIGESQFG